LRNILFEIPLVRRHLFLRDAQKIVPSLRLEDVRFARRIGGIRPQLIDKRTNQIMLGEAKIDDGNGIIFNMTPSPGASSCLDHAQRDLRSLTHYLNAEFDAARFQEDLAG
jgi:malate dehydrogenase (quinone)